MDIKKSRQLGLAVIAIVYIAAGVLAFYVSDSLASYDLVSRIFWADIQLWCQKHRCLAVVHSYLRLGSTTYRKLGVYI